MKSIYNAVRSILFPQSRFPRAGVHFAAGTHPYAKDNRYPPHLCQALMNLEQSNRGHRHLLAAPALRVDSNAATVDFDKRNLIKVRRIMRNSLRDLFRSVLALEWESPEGDFQGLLDSYDRQGYMPSIVFDEIKFACKAAHLTWLPAWLEVTAVRVETGDEAVLHLRLTRTWDNASAKRSIPLVHLDRVSLREAKIFYNDSVHRVREALKDAARWPEFVTPENQSSSVSTHSPEERAQINELAGRLVEDSFQHSQVPAETWCFSQGESAKQALQSDTEGAPVRGMPATHGSTVHVFVVEDAPESAAGLATALPSKMVTLAFDDALSPESVNTALLDRLNRHMQDFVGMYSPEVQRLLAENWEQFKPTVPEQ